MEWAPIGPQLARPVTLDIVGGLNLAWGLFSGFGVGPNCAPAVGPHVGYYVDVWAKLGLFLGPITGYGVGPSPSTPSWAPLWIFVWAKLGLGFWAYGVGPIP